MINNKVLVAGIGNSKQTKKFYDNWSTNYDKTLYNWNYKAPKKTTLILLVLFLITFGVKLST